MDHPTSTASSCGSLEAGFQGVQIAVTLWRDGRPREIESYQGESLMVALKRAGLSLLAVCGGKGACGTCKVTFPPEWAAKLPAPQIRELRLLTQLKAREGERLSCRIPLTAELDGLEVEASD